MEAVADSKALVVKSPKTWKRTGVSVFLCGSIDGNTAENWQERLTTELNDLDITVVNPRRDDWNNEWKEDISNSQFREQVEWELDSQDDVDVIPVYFDPKGKAPITLLELGLYADTGKMIVCCPTGYWKRGNVEIVCKRYGIPFYSDFKPFVSAVRKKVQSCE